MAEAVFQIIRENPRGGGLATAISSRLAASHSGRRETPVGGIDLTHRVGVLFAGGITASGPWERIPAHFGGRRAVAERMAEPILSLTLPQSVARCSFGIPAARPRRQPSR